MKLTTRYDIGTLIIYETGQKSDTSRIVGIRTVTDAKLTTKIYYELYNGAVVSIDNAISEIAKKADSNDVEVSKKYLNDQVYPHDSIN